MARWISMYGKWLKKGAQVEAQRLKHAAAVTERLTEQYVS